MSHVQFLWPIYFPAPESGHQGGTVKQIIYGAAFFLLHTFPYACPEPFHKVFVSS